MATQSFSTYDDRIRALPIRQERYFFAFGLLDNTYADSFHVLGVGEMK
jgi:hypothetical protein